MAIEAIHSGSRNNEDGYIMISSLMVLALVSIIGVMSIRTSNNDLGSSTNDQFYNLSFYSAEAARAFVYSNPVLYGSDNITFGTPVAFPDSDDPTIVRQIIAGAQEVFKGSVEYLNASVPYRGSGFAVGKFKAHNYRMICEGHAQYNGPRDSTTRIESGFYRIGF
jgi:hypothetical protein